MNDSGILWWILGCTTFISLFGAVTASVNEEIYRATRREAQKYRKKVRVSMVGAVMAMVAGLAMAALWIVYAVQVHDWRFGAIAGVPVVIQWLTKLFMPVISEESTRISRERV